MEEPTRNLKVVVISRETIKPFPPPSPPHHQKNFKLSLLDQIVPSVYVPVILFYKGTGTPYLPCGGDWAEKVDERSQRLKSSLSETLSRFYPLAGRLNDNLSLSCNDEGVEYLEAQVALSWSLSDVLEKPNPDQLGLLVPAVVEEEESCLDLSTCPLCLVQVSFFGCGGVAIGMKICHTIADATTIASFIVGWANNALGGNLDPVMPDFCSSDLFPPMDSFPNSSASQLIPTGSPNAQVQLVVNKKWQDDVRTSRFHFGKSELVALQAKAASTNIPRPTRVEAVTALLWRILLLAKKEPKPSVLINAVNLRPRLEPPLSEHSFGNLLSVAFIQCQRSTEEEEVDIPKIVDDLRRERIDMCTKMVKTLDQGFWRPDPNAGELFSKARYGAIELFLVTSWCKIPFYEADFGWGKPVWATNGGFPKNRNVIMLMDTRDGQGIDAWVYLREEEMNLFKSNQELLNYASLNPSALN